MSFPSQVCFGDPVSGSTVVRNDSQCESEYRVRYDVGGDTATASSAELAPGEEFEFQLDVSRMPESQLRVEEIVEVKVGDVWEPLDERVTNIEPLFSEFQLVSASYPAHVQPGNPVAANLTVQNVGDCPGRAEISGTRFQSRNVELEPGETTNFQHRFNMPGSRVPISLQVLNQDRGIDEDGVDRRIDPQQTVIIDEEEGTLEFLGGFNTNLGYNGIIQGRGIEGESLDSEDNLIGGRVLGAVSGNASTSPEDRDIIKFSTLDFLNVQFGSNIQWVRNGNILGEASSFQFSKYPIGFAENALPLPAEDPEISIRASPTDRLGKVRRVAGLNAKLIDQPVFQRMNKEV